MGQQQNPIRVFMSEPRVITGNYSLLRPPLGCSGLSASLLRTIKSTTFNIKSTVVFKASKCATASHATDWQWYQTVEG